MPRVSSLDSTSCCARRRSAADSGEHLLAELLAQVLPQASFKLQYGFSDGTRVDAAVRAGERWVPVDAKFPLDNERARQASERSGDVDGARRAQRAFRRDVRRHVDAIATRYIRPGEGTYDFALMYLPAESLYHAILADDESDDLLHYALSRRVVPVSPRSFYAYLQVLLTGLRGLAAERRAREWVDGVVQLQRDVERLDRSLDTLERHLQHGRRQAEEVRRQSRALGVALGRWTALDDASDLDPLDEVVTGDLGERDADSPSIEPR